MPPLDGGGEGGRTRRLVQQTIYSHTDLPVDLLGRPVGGQATLTTEDGRP